MGKNTTKKAIEIVLDEYKGLEIDDDVMEYIIEDICNVIWANDIEKMIREFREEK